MRRASDRCELIPSLAGTCNNVDYIHAQETNLTPFNVIQQGYQARATCLIQQCLTMLIQDVGFVWTTLSTLYDKVASRRGLIATHLNWNRFFQL